MGIVPRVQFRSVSSGSERVFLPCHHLRGQGHAGVSLISKTKVAKLDSPQADKDRLVAQARGH